eukprot:COSAG02_NODE_9238_length_2280_cov_1.972031_2_plen_69_part_00
MQRSGVTNSGGRSVSRYSLRLVQLRPSSNRCALQRWCLSVECFVLLTVYVHMYRRILHIADYCCIITH